MTLLTDRLQTLAQVRAFLDGTDAVELAAADRQAAYGFISNTFATSASAQSSGGSLPVTSAA